MVIAKAIIMVMFIIVFSNPISLIFKNGYG
jgi:hypothetical protein